MSKIQDAYLSEVGLSVYKGDWAGAEWTITGNAKKEKTIKEFDSAYDFEEYIQKKIDCTDIKFDSEYCQFFAYAPTEERAIQFAKSIDDFFKKIRELID